MSAPAWASWWARSCCSVVGQLCFLLPPVQIDDYRVGLLPCRGDALQQPVGVECRGHNAPFGQLVGDEAVAELRIVVVDVDRGVDQMRVVPVALADRGGLPRVERLLRSCRARGRSPRHGSCWRRALGPAGTSFWEHVAGEVRRRPAQDLVLLLQLLGSLTQLAVLGLQVPASAQSAGCGGPSRPGVLAVGDLQSPGETGLRDSEAPRDPGDGLVVLAGDRDHVAPELQGSGLGTVLILPARPQPHRQGVNRTLGSPLRVPPDLDGGDEPQHDDQGTVTPPTVH